MTGMSAEQEVTYRASSLSCSGTPCTCRIHETRDKQLGAERSAVLVAHLWSASDLQWYLAQCSISSRWSKDYMQSLFLFLLWILGVGPGCQCVRSCSAHCMAPLGSQRLLLWEQNRFVGAVLWCLAKQICKCNYRLRGEVNCCLKCQIPLEMWI